MISSKNRSYYIGASDTSMVVGNWNTKTFEKWYLEKLGLNKNDFTNEAMQTGTAFEHKILDKISEDLKVDIEKDRQIIKNRLRVNLDGSTSVIIYEVKTYNENKGFKVSKQYWRQAQVEMYASGIHHLFIVAYALSDNDYKNFYNEVDSERITFIKIDYDSDFIENEYLPKFKILSECLEKGEFPTCKQLEK